MVARPSSSEPFEAVAFDLVGSLPKGEVDVFAVLC